MGYTVEVMIAGKDRAIHPAACQVNIELQPVQAVLQVEIEPFTSYGVNNSLDL
ncbi:MAG: hypothetical protein KKD69_00140 [Euryarchaeota archaeon]|nr:hypothetical protein [Euryarchaeota archaeon]MCG2728061.1 hypothetical protein [Candidatus Methanoperedenaceae archaeon]